MLLFVLVFWAAGGTLANMPAPRVPHAARELHEALKGGHICRGAESGMAF